MKVLCTGATGFLGGEIARELLRRGHTVRVLLRKTAKLEGLQGLAVEHAAGDILDRGSIDAALAGIEGVIHTAGHVGQKLRERDAIFRVNVEGTRNMLTAAMERGLRTVYTSSMVAIGITEQPTAQTEESPWANVPGYAYADAKKQAEDLAFDLFKRGLEVVILNPGMILGAGDVYSSSTRYVLEYLNGRNRFHFGVGGNSYCHVGDVARAHVNALEGKGRPGERYIVTGHNQSQKEMLERLYRLTNLHAPRRIPYGLAWAGALFSEGLSALWRHPWEDLNRPLLRYSRRWAFSDCGKARRELGYEVTPLDDALRETIRDLVARGRARPSTPELQTMVS